MNVVVEAYIVHILQDRVRWYCNSLELGLHAAGQAAAQTPDLENPRRRKPERKTPHHPEQRGTDAGNLLQMRLIEIGRASCRKECRSRWSPYH